MATSELAEAAWAAEEPTRSFDRAVVYRALARLFLPPSGASLVLVRQELAELQRALARLEPEDEVRTLAAVAAETIAEVDAGGLRDAYQRLFEASGGLACPPYETSVAPSTPQEGLTRTFEMADVAYPFGEPRHDAAGWPGYLWAGCQPSWPSATLR